MDELAHYVRQGKPFDKYSIKDELEVMLNALLEEAHDHKKATAHE